MKITSVILHPIELGLICMACFVAGAICCLIISDLIEWRHRKSEDD